jgi:hypothetical protein
MEYDRCRIVCAVPQYITISIVQACAVPQALSSPVAALARNRRDPAPWPIYICIPDRRLAAPLRSGPAGGCAFGADTVAWVPVDGVYMRCIDVLKQAYGAMLDRTTFVGGEWDRVCTQTYRVRQSLRSHGGCHLPGVCSPPAGGPSILQALSFLAYLQFAYT